MSLKITCFFLILFPSLAFGQEYFFENSVKVFQDVEYIKNPWAGGINAAHINSIDLDLDGEEDLIVFEKTDRSILTFLLDNSGEYVYAPEFINLIPKITGWILTRDINGDGKKDIFTADPLGIRVFINNLPYGFDLYPVAPLLTKNLGENINIYTSERDLPIIQDVDDDGDLDIVHVQFSGTTLEWHKNLQVEENLTDTIKFVKQSDSWGNIRICGCENILSNSEQCPPPAGRIDHATGHALLLLDMTGDGNKDLVFSDSECGNLRMIVNTGSNSSPDFEKKATSVPGVNVTMPFPVPFYEDVDQDGVDDLILSTNSALLNNFSVDYKNSVWLFKNSGTSQKPGFSHVKDNFLQSNMLDVGQNSKATYFDLDNDGDKDMVISNLISRISNSFLTGFSYYENIGTYSEPEFSLVTRDLFGLSALSFYNFKQQFFDVTGDRKPEFVFSATSLVGGETNIYYFKNIGQINFNTDFELQVLHERIPFDANFLLHDLYSDGIPDLLITTSIGISRYESQNKEFILADTKFLSLGSSINGLEVADIDGDGNEDFIYSRHGEIKVIYDYIKNTFSEYLVLLDGKNGNLIEQNIGSKLQITAEKLLGNNVPELVIGNNKGGLTLLKSNEAVEAEPVDPILVFPNPILKDKDLILKSRRNLLLYILSADGRIIVGPEYLPSFELYSFNLSKLAAGMYIVHVLVDQETSWQKKIVVVK